jgi:dihydrofolate synthase/folylpolyglutamate synthase
MDYQETLAWLNDLASLGIKAGLGHTRFLAERLGGPQKRFPSILVAGTNGKGSACAVLEGALRASGLRTGFYSSPHLVDVRERIRIGGELISREAFALALSKVRLAFEDASRCGEIEAPPTFFEALTLAAFLAFAEAGVEIAVLEVGLGGRLDCTNIAEPILSMVTSIGLDHQQFLGETVAQIAREKAGIFRAGVQALTSASNRDALGALKSQAEKLGASLATPDEMQAEILGRGWKLSCPEGGLELPMPALAGEHQIENAALAARAALMLRSRGWNIPDSAIAFGVAHARWPGRLQRILDFPATYLDGAHNPDGCAALARFALGLPRPRALVFTCMKDKPFAQLANILSPVFDGVWLTGLPMQRCAAPEEIAASAPWANSRIEPGARKALEEARAFAGPEGSVVAGGSLYLVGHLLQILGAQESSLFGTGL